MTTENRKKEFELEIINPAQVYGERVGSLETIVAESTSLGMIYDKISDLFSDCGLGIRIEDGILTACELSCGHYGEPIFTVDELMPA